MYVDPHDYSTITVLLYGCYPTDVNQLPSAVSFDRVVFVVFSQREPNERIYCIQGISRDFVFIYIFWIDIDYD